MAGIDENLAFAPATELKELIANKKVSPVEITQLYLDRINTLDGQLNSYLTVTSELALESARKAEKAVVAGDELGPLHGIPISIKDLQMTKGVKTTGGSLAYKDRVPDADCAVVERVLSAGAIMLGKTNSPEFGLLGANENRLGDPCRNPWNPERTSGGSSGGAGASIIAGLTSLATGGDGGGSIRIHSREMQSAIFEILGIDSEEAETKFGFLLTAMDYGAPPHGGIAFGLDRLVMHMANTENIREVIAFPKTQMATDLLTGAPTEASAKQLREAGIRLRPTSS